MSALQIFRCDFLESPSLYRLWGVALAQSANAVIWVAGYPAGGNVAIADGATSGTFSVSVNGDTTVESDESFTVSISAPTGYDPGATMSSTGTILNDDAPPATGDILDAITATPSAAFGLRRLKSSYTGPLIRVVRADATEQDIYATSAGDLDTAALLAFTGTGSSNTGTIKTWYDQSGAGQHATNTTAANQPGLVAAGVVQTRNSKLSLSFGASKSLASALSASLAVRQSVLSVTSVPTQTATSSAPAPTADEI